MPPFVRKGDRIRARWFQPKPTGSYSLAGVQLKFVGTFVEVTGVVRHVRGDALYNPTVIRLYVDPDGDGYTTMRPPGCTCSTEHVEVSPDHVIGYDEKEAENG